jgi:hypothetical protein
MIRTLAFSVLTVALPWAAQAADATRVTFDHPAVAVARMSHDARIDPNTFIVQPPASVSWTVPASSKAAHANFDHPALAAGRLSREAHIDANSFLVQPPASVSWTVLPETKVVAAAQQR